MRKRELKDNLRYFSEDFDINIVEGEKFLEVKSSSIKAYNILYEIIEKVDYSFSSFIGNLNRFPKMEEILADDSYLFELNSANLDKSYKIDNPREILKLLYSN